jgi:hypothetical protein
VLSTTVGCHRCWPHGCDHAAARLRGPTRHSRADYQKEPALSLAARYGYLQVVDTILQDRRADRNSVDDQGCTAGDAFDIQIIYTSSSTTIRGGLYVIYTQTIH